MEPSGPSKKAIISLVVVVLLVVVATAVVAASGNKNTAADGAQTASTTQPSPSSDTSTTSSTNASSGATSFKDGTYSATGTYNSPGGPQSIGVKITLSGGVVTDSSVTEQPNDNDAQQYQDQFVSAYRSQVVGKKITDINLSRVAGSSLTSIGFNSAIADIEKQAQV